MNQLKFLLQEFPEYYLTILVLLAGFTPPISIHPFSSLLAILLILQIVFKNKLSGLLITTVFVIMSMFMFLSLLSELSEFTIPSTNAAKLLLVGLPLSVLNILAVVIMVKKYAFDWSLKH
ncbi:hypothetical protein [Mangrovimonas sp. TPBH4]|uniref:hypothetical protein n=1 Tax=Mangrovimonas sp. TPBH4 TaxID=1645914 RepID=UPI0012FB7EA2|nr:hypothetical protein [Mangrovimonas sp. TPBH4]